jgi:hypothetical protein
MKMRVIQMRANWKDYVDIRTLALHGIDVSVGLAAAKAIDRSFDPATSIRALQFYGDGTLHRDPVPTQRDLTRWAQAVDLEKLPTLHPRRSLSPGGHERCLSRLPILRNWFGWQEKWSGTTVQSKPWPICQLS